MNGELRTAVVGVGNIGSAHSMCIFEGKVPGMKLCAVCDISEDRRGWASKRLPGTPVYDDYLTMLEEARPQAVIIATPHRLHPPMAHEAFLRNINVMSEKPAGIYARDARRMAAEARERGVVYSVMFNQRTEPIFIRARELVCSGALGEIKRISWIITNWYRTQGYYDSGSWRGTWSGEGGGVLMNQAPHNLDLLCWICGLPVKVRARCFDGKYHDIEVEDEAVLHMEMENGALCDFVTTTGEYPGTNRLEIAGTLGKLVTEEGKLRFWKLPRSEREICLSDAPLPEPEYSEFSGSADEDGHILILRNFTRAVLYGEKLISPGEDGENELLLSNAAYYSSWNDAETALPCDEDRLYSMLESRCGKEKKLSACSKADGLFSSRWKVKW